MAMIFFLGFSAIHAENTRFLHWPDIYGNQIVFVYGGNLWLTNTDRGPAVRLTSPPAQESRPHFSPDGRWIVFTAKVDGNDDIYIIPSEGGTARRLTYHPESDLALGWSPDGTRILFASRRANFAHRYNLFTIDVNGGHPEMFPMHKGFEATFSPDGKYLAYTPTRNAYLTWKRYGGGETPPIWIVDLSNYTHSEIPHENASDTFPVWLNNQIYFLSDRSGVMGLYEYDTRSKHVRLLVENGITDIDHIGGGSEKLVYTSGGYLFIYDISARNSVRVKVDIPDKAYNLNPKRTNVSGLILGAALSPHGEEVAFQARGEVIIFTPEGGIVRNLTGTSGARDIFPAWSPNGTKIACLSDASGEYALHIADAKTGEVMKKIDFPKPDYYRHPQWSPDGTKIAYFDKMRNIGIVDIAKGKHLKIESYIDYEDVIAWSPDSKWIAYGDRKPTLFRVLKLYSFDNNRSYCVTDGIGDAFNPTFSKDGNCLFFLGSTNIGPIRATMDLSALPFVNEATWDIYGIPLRNDVPVLSVDKEGETNVEEAKTEKAKKKELNFRIEVDDITSRIFRLPVQPGRYSDLAAAADGQILFTEAIQSIPFPDEKKLHRFDTKSAKLKDVLPQVSSYQLSADGATLLYSLNKKWGIVSVMESHKQGAGMIDLSKLEIRVNPEVEWRQIFVEAWRKHRDYFFDENMHGVDWEAIRKRYESYLPDLRFRSDLNFVLRHMLGEAVNSHTRIAGGDIPGFNEIQAELGASKDAEVKIPLGLLGADYEVKNGRYKIKRILRTSFWDRDQEQSPLSQPGIDVKEGDYILEVNGKELKYPANIYSSFEKTAGTQVILKINGLPQLEGSRSITVIPLDSERKLRLRSWIEKNRRKVDELSGGAIAYVYQPDTGLSSVREFLRYFFPQSDRAGIIIDERFNDGGADTDYQLDILDRQQVHWYDPRQDIAVTSPFYMIMGPKVMLVNAEAGSGGDVLPYQFTLRGLGTTVGTRTWGGVMGGSDGAYYQMIDGGIATTPSLGTYSPEGDYILENCGFTPEHVVHIFPRNDYLGQDPQLEKAVELIIEELKKKPPKKIPQMERKDWSLEAIRKK